MPLNKTQQRVVARLPKLPQLELDIMGAFGCAEWLRPFVLREGMKRLAEEQAHAEDAERSAGHAIQS